MKQIGSSGVRWSGLVLLAVGAIAAGCGSSSESPSGASSRERPGAISSPLTPVQVPPTGNVSTIAGKVGTPGNVDGALGTNLLNDPAGVAVATDGTIYVADWNNNAIRRIKTDGTLDTLLKGSPNLVRNPRFEAAVATKCVLGNLPSQWTKLTTSSLVRTVDASCVGQQTGLTGNAFDGGQWAYGSYGIYQDIPLTAAQITAAAAGKLHSRLAVEAREDSGAKAEVQLALYDTMGTRIPGYAFDSGVPVASTTSWHLIAGDALLPTNVGTIRIHLRASSGNVAYDAVQLHLIDLSQPSSNDAQLTGPTSVAVEPFTNGQVYIAASGGVYRASGTSAVALVPNAPYVAPTSPTSVTAYQNHILIADSGSTKLHIRDGNGVQYFFDVGGSANAEPVAATGNFVGLSNGASQYNLIVTYRGSADVRAWSCPGGNTTIGATITCNKVGQAGSTPGYADNTSGTIGSERFGLGNVGLALSNQAGAGARVGLLADYDNNTIRRLNYPFTLTSAGTTTAGSADGAPTAAKFFGPSAVAVTPNNNVVVADRLNHTVRLIACADMNVCAPNTNGHATTVSDPTCTMPITSADDGNVCTTDSCQIVAITHTANTLSCSDGNACTTTDTCSAGSCVPGPSLSVDDNNLCTVDSCDAATGAVHTPKTFTDSDLTDCFVPTCDPATGNAKSTQVPEGTSCGVANSGRRCDAKGVCEAAAPTFTAPTLDGSTGTDFGALTGGIWSGSSPSQKNADGTKISATKIEASHAGWIIGQVKSSAGLPLPNVIVSVAGDPSYGQTLTRSDGKFDFVVNGGRSYVMRFEKTGHFPVDRQVYVGWEETSVVASTTLLTQDPNATALAFGLNGAGTTSFQVATGSKSVDDDGTRTGVLMLPKGIKAMVNGAAQAALNVRITEYTVGTDGPARMPATLPATSAYTYAVELSADGASAVNFTNANGTATPVYYYTENFLGAAVGTAVPSGYYDRAAQSWIASDNGLVIKIIKGKSLPTGSQSQISVNADDGVDNVLTDPAYASLGFTSDELVALASKYADGTTLWRVPVTHMTPWDFNYGKYLSCAKCELQPFVPTKTPQPGCTQSVPGSIIGCENQTLGESLGVAGTPFTLNYNSSRMPLYANWRTLGLSVNALPDGVGANVQVAIAGKLVFDDTFSSGPAAVHTSYWDGTDAFGRPVIGSATATIQAQWYGGIEYLAYVDKFGNEITSSFVPGTFVRKIRPYSFSSRQTVNIPAQAPLVGKGSWMLGGWTLSDHHFYDPKGNVIYLGSGQTRRVDPGIYTVRRVLGDGSSIGFAADGDDATKPKTGIDQTQYSYGGLGVGPNGDIYYADPPNHVVRRINSLGKVKTIAGDPKVARTAINGGDGGDSVINGHLKTPARLAVGVAGEIYIWDADDYTIRVLWPNGPDTFLIDTIAGQSGVRSTGSAQSGVPAKGSVLPYGISSLAVGPDGSLYLGDTTHNVISRIKIDATRTVGNIDTVAGNGSGLVRTDGSAARSVGISTPSAIGLGMEGSVYGTTGSDLYRILPDGTLRILSQAYPVLGTDFHPPLEGVQISQDYVDHVRAMAIGTDGSVFFNDRTNPSVIRRVDRTGVVEIISAAEGNNSVALDGGAARLKGPSNIAALAIAPDGSILAFSSTDHSLYRIATNPVSPITACADATAAYLVPNGDQAFCFDKTGRHLSTVNWRTRQTLLQFGYDTQGRLISITDKTTSANQVTAIDYDTVAKKYTITAPYLQSTTIHVDDAGNATGITDVSSGAKTTLVPEQSGLLDSLTDRNLNQFNFTFQTGVPSLINGLLLADKSPLSTGMVPGQTLSRSSIAGGYEVTHTTPLARVTTYDVTTDAIGSLSTKVTLPDHTTRTRTEKPDGSSDSTATDGTKTVVAELAPDPVLGFQQPYVSNKSIKLPGGVTLQTSTVVCKPSSSGTTTTQFTATSQNPSSTLACNLSVPADPLTDQPQATPKFVNPKHTTIKRITTTSDDTTIVTSPMGRLTTQVRDLAGRITSSQIASLTPTTYEYDTSVGHEGQLHFVKRGVRWTELDYRTKYESDPVNKITADTDAGYIERIIDAAGNKTDFTRDAFGRPHSMVEAKGVSDLEGTTAFDFDGNGNLKLVTPPTLHTHYLLYDAINGLKTYTPPTVTGIVNPATSYVPSADRTPLTETRPDGGKLSYTLISSPYNTDQIDTITFPGAGSSSPAGTLDYDYYPATDPNGPGKVQYIKGPYGTTKLTYAYDGALTSQVSWSGDVAGSVAWSYNPRFLKKSETVTPSGTGVSYFGYDDDGLLTCVSVTAPAANTEAACSGNDLALTRSADHGLVTDIVTGKVKEHIDYSDTAADALNKQAFGELRHQHVTYDDGTANGVVLADFTYDTGTQPRDDLGRIRTKTEVLHDATGSGSGSTTTSYDYEYDERNRLEAVLKNSLDSEAFAYDTNGNRKSYTAPTGSIASSATLYDNQDRLMTYGATTFTYGANGEIATKTVGGVVTTYTYDMLGNLTKVHRSNNPNDVIYYVDGLGRRIGKKVGTTVNKRWIYRDGLNPVAEIDGNTGAIVARYVYGSRPNVPDLVITGTGSSQVTYRLITDQLGSPRLAVNVSKPTDPIPYRADYSAFGVVTVPPGFAASTLDWIPFGFAGGMYDRETGLVRYGARDYDPSIGRWVSKDPIRFDADQTNLYTYVNNDPVNAFDTRGTKTSTCGWVVGAATTAGCWYVAGTLGTTLMCFAASVEVGDYVCDDLADDINNAANSVADLGSSLVEPDPSLPGWLVPGLGYLNDLPLPPMGPIAPPGGTYDPFNEECR